MSAAVALLPLDERPVNTTLPRDVAALAGVDLALPPAELLPHGRRGGDVEGLGRWLRSQAERGAGSIGVCLDTLVHGGLIAARISDDPVEACLGRMSVLAEVAARRPSTTLEAVSLVTRASDADDAGEEPQYWSRHGRRLHRLGALLHRRFEDALGREGLADLEGLEGVVPAEIRRDFEHRRLRNHMINLRALDLASQGVLNTLLITADDTARFSAGSLEQLWLGHWSRALPAGGTVMMYPGADEVGCTLVARALNRMASAPEAGPEGASTEPAGRAPVRIAVACALPDDMDRVPPFENSPLNESVLGQVEAAGAVPVAGQRWSLPAEPADVLLVVHPAGVEGLDLVVDAPPEDPDPAAATADLVERALAGGKPVVVADVRYANGSDPLLVAALRRRGLLDRLAGYAGWNTAGNTLGTAVGVGVAVAVGERLGSGSPHQLEKLLVHRLLEDDVYQARGRRVLREELGLASTGTHFGPGQEARAVTMASRMLGEGLRDLGFAGWRVENVGFPWHRTFEIDFELVSG